MKIQEQILLICAALLLLCPVSDSGQLLVIELRHRTADEIVNVVKPLLGPEDTISGKRYTVFVTSTPENLARIESIIRNIDRPSRQLMITIVQGENAREALASVDISGNLSIGDRGRVEFGRNPQPEDTVSITGRSSRSATSEKDIQQLRVQEGMATFFYIGQSIPIPLQATAPQLPGRRPENVVEYRNVRTGFRAVPRLSGDRFVLDITSQRESTFSTRHGVVDAQQVQTQVQGRLNEWTDIAGVLGLRQVDETGWVYDDRIQQRNQHPVYLIMVEVTP